MSDHLHFAQERLARAGAALIGDPPDRDLALSHMRLGIKHAKAAADTLEKFLVEHEGQGELFDAPPGEETVGQPVRRGRKKKSDIAVAGEIVRKIADLVGPEVTVDGAGVVLTPADAEEPAATAPAEVEVAQPVANANVPAEIAQGVATLHDGYAPTTSPLGTFYLRPGQESVAAATQTIPCRECRETLSIGTTIVVRADGWWIHASHRTEPPEARAEARAERGAFDSSDLPTDAELEQAEAAAAAGPASA